MSKQISSSGQSYVISVSLCAGCYRHIRISADDTLYDLHSAILKAFDFVDDHAHAFFMDNKLWGNKDSSYMAAGMSGSRSTSDYRLKQLSLKPGSKFKYVFDFGEEWAFDLRVLRLLDEATDSPRIVRSAGESPSQYDWDEEDEPNDERDDDDMPDFLPELYPPWKIQSLYKALPLPQPTVKLLLQYFDAFSNLYWIIPLQKAFDIYNSQNPPIEEAHFLQFVEVARHDDCLFYILGEDEIYVDWEKEALPMERLIVDKSLFMDDEDEWAALLQNQEGKPYYVPPKETLLKYSDEFYYEKTEEFFAFRDYLQKERKLSKIRAEDIADEMQLHAYMGNHDDLEFIQFNAERMGLKLDDMDDVVQFFEHFFALSNNTRMPINRGHTPNEMAAILNQKPGSVVFKDGLKKAIRDRMISIDDLRDFAAETAFPTNELQLSFLDQVDQIEKKLAAEDADRQNSKPAAYIPRNAPCPCGSGRKYKHCCGKGKPPVN